MTRYRRHHWRIGHCVLLAGALLMPLRSVHSADAASPAPSRAEGADPDAKNIRLNFKKAPLDTVLDHLSEAAGFAVVKDVDVNETVDVWSHQPLSPDEAVELLNTVLTDRGLAAVRTGRTLRIVSRAKAKEYDLPVRTGADPAAIAVSDAMVTQVIPVRHANATKLLDNLRPLLSDGISMTANESSNAIILTDTQTNVKRMATVIQALDTSISAVSEIHVFPLQYADAEDLAKVINEAFETPSEQSSSRDQNSRRSFFMRMRGGPGGGETQSDDSKKGLVIPVKAVADTHSNCVVVSAPTDLTDDIEQLVKQVDIAVEEAVQLRVFPLKYADAEEIAENIVELFESESDSDDNSNRGPMPGPPGMPPMFGRNNRNSNSSDSGRTLNETEVNAVADTRTNAVVVTASQKTLVLIEGMIKQLDATPKNVAQVYVYRIRYANLETLQEMLEGMFEDLDETSSTSGTSSTIGAGAAMRSVTP